MKQVDLFQEFKGNPFFMPVYKKLVSENPFSVTKKGKYLFVSDKVVFSLRKEILKIEDSSEPEIVFRKILEGKQHKRRDDYDPTRYLGAEKIRNSKQLTQIFQGYLPGT